MLIQIVEDDRALSNGVKLALQEPEINFSQSGSVQQAKESFECQLPDLIILDINLSDGSGYDYLKWVRERSVLPVLILTANDMEMDEVMGLTLGADDYMTKPFSLAVLRARIQALSRRIKQTESMKQSQEVYQEDVFLFHFDTMKYFRKDQEIFLSVNEQKLLRLLVSNKGNLLTRNYLLDRIWSDGGEYVDENALSVTVNRLRSKLEQKKEGVTYIQTVYGQGYTWRKQEK